MVVEKVMERFAVSKQEAQKFKGERFNLRKVKELEVRKQYKIKITNRFVVLENLNNSEDINRTWENIKDNIKTSATEVIGVYELKQHKSLFDEVCSCFLYQRKQTKMQWSHHLNQSNEGNQNNVRHEASRHFRNKREDYLKVEIDELEGKK
jgi:hypothetical protein